MIMTKNRRDRQCSSSLTIYTHSAILHDYHHISLSLSLSGIRWTLWCYLYDSVMNRLFLKVTSNRWPASLSKDKIHTMSIDYDCLCFSVFSSVMMILQSGFQ